MNAPFLQNSLDTSTANVDDDALVVKANSARICIVAQNSYGAMCGGLRGHIGGAERQTAMLAKWFARQGYCTSLITWDEGQPDYEYIDDVAILKLCRQEAGIPGVRLIHPRATSLFAALQQADADIYYHNAAELVTGAIALWCRSRRRRFVYSVASDAACYTHLPTLSRVHERALYRYGLRKADTVIVQTEQQRHLLRDGFRVDSLVLPMPCEAPVAKLDVLSREPRRVLWVGRIDIMKRLDWLLDVAERLPDIQFDVVGAANSTQLGTLGGYVNSLRVRASSIRNVCWHGSMPHDSLWQMYRASLCLCCTSSYEGFPNTFLEAWSQGLPVITSFDPDKLVQTKGLGSYVADVNGFVVEIKRLADTRTRLEEQSLRCMEYFRAVHDANVALPRFERALMMRSPV